MKSDDSYMSISSESNSIPRRYLIIKSYVYELTGFYVMSN